MGNNFAESFLYSNVFNFPSDYGGPPNKITVPNPQFRQFGPLNSVINPPPFIPAPGAVFGIWNGASIETIEFTQRFDQYNLTFRQPIYETETYRLSGLVGPRLSWIWQRFAWRATDLDTDGNSGPQFQALYTNDVSNRLYGGHAGFSNECYLGHGVAVNFEQLDEERSVVAYRVAEVLRRRFALLTRPGDAVRGSVLLDELGMLDRDVGHPLLEVVHRVATIPHHPLNEIVSF